MVKRRNKRGGQISAWSQSAAFREIGRAAITAFNKRRHLRKKCGAKTRGTGDPCQNIAKENGRCWLHGGLTPKGDQWHVRQLPTGKGSKVAVRKYDAKLAKANKDAAARRLRLMRATDAEREAYQKWLWARPAGSAAQRAARRAEARMRRRIAEEKQELARGLRLETADPELEAMQARLAKLRAMLEQVKKPDLGVFG